MRWQTWLGAAVMCGLAVGCSGEKQSGTVGDGELDPDALRAAEAEEPIGDPMGGGPGGGGPGFGGPGGGGPGGGGRGGGFDPAAIFAERDANGDGKLTADEIDERFRDGMASMDTDGDEALSLEEFQAGMQAMFSGGGRGGGGGGRGGGGGGYGGDPREGRPDRPQRPESDQ